jgi:hypothetical protein
MDLKQPSFERGCVNKTNLGRNYKKNADKLAAKHGKQYGVYHCPHCKGCHLTTKLLHEHLYTEALVYKTTPLT